MALQLWYLSLWMECKLQYFSWHEISRTRIRNISSRFFRACVGAFHSIQGILWAGLSSSACFGSPFFLSSTVIFSLCIRRETCFVSKSCSFCSISSKALCTGSGSDGSILPGNGTANLHRRASAADNTVATRVINDRVRIVEIVLAWMFGLLYAIVGGVMSKIRGDGTSKVVFSKSLPRYYCTLYSYLQVRAIPGYR